MAEPPKSLIDRIAHAAPVARRWRLGNPRFAAALAALIALGPLLTIVGAGLLRVAIERDHAALIAQGRARFEAEGEQRAAALAFRDAVRGATAAVTLDRIARALPDDARLVSVARNAGGGLEVEIAASDPDALRSALRRDPLFAAMRETGQRRTADARLVVTLKGRR